METSKVSTNSRVVIPGKIRQMLGLKRETRVEFIEKGGKIL